MLCLINLSMDNHTTHRQNV